MPNLRGLRQRRDALKSEGRDLLDKVRAEKRDPTEAEDERLNEIEVQLDALDTDIAEEERREDRARRFAEDLGDMPPAAADEGGNAGGFEALQVFASFGEQLKAIHEHYSAGVTDPRLGILAEAAGGAAGVPSDAGYIIQHDFVQSIEQKVWARAQLVSKVDPRIPVTGSGIKIPYLIEKSRATGSRFGGVQVYRVKEAATVEAKRPKLGRQEMELEKLMGLAYVTAELLEDAPAMSAIYETAFANEIAFVLDDELVRGSGAGEMLGFLNSKAKVTVAKEAGQQAVTVVSENLYKMFARMPGGMIREAEWLVNQDCMPAIFALGQAVGVGGVPLFIPPGGLSAAPAGAILGRPITVIEQAETLGTEGDISFVNIPMGYRMIEKGGLRFARSMHVRFLYDEEAFRFTIRNNGQPTWEDSVTPYKGTAKVSPFVTLATRA